MTTTISADTSANSESESLDSLDYDDWEGQFEFIGNNNQQTTTATSTTPSTIANNKNRTNHPVRSLSMDDDGDDDLNLTSSHHTLKNGSSATILIDEMTFLTVPSNGDDDSHCFTNENQIAHQSPASGYFIENALTNFDSVPFNGKQLIKENHNRNISNLVNNNNNNRINCNRLNDNNNDILNQQLHHANIDDVVNMKNKLNYLTNGQRNNNNNNNYKINGFSTDLCDNLTEQVSNKYDEKSKSKKSRRRFCDAVIYE